MCVSPLEICFNFTCLASNATILTSSLKSGNLSTVLCAANNELDGISRLEGDGEVSPSTVGRRHNYDTNK